jgi:hypothetical protein
MEQTSTEEVKTTGKVARTLEEWPMATALTRSRFGSNVRLVHYMNLVHPKGETDPKIAAPLCSRKDGSHPVHRAAEGVRLTESEWKHSAREGHTALLHSTTESMSRNVGLDEQCLLVEVRMQHLGQPCLHRGRGSLLSTVAGAQRGKEALGVRGAQSPTACGFPN